MSLHRMIALVSALSLVGLFGLASRAEASNFSRPQSKYAVTLESLREKVKNADIEGCG
jgi:hypothetical protein